MQPVPVRPALRQAFPLAPEFIGRQDGDSKQDCGTNAAKRAIRRIRREYRQLAIILVGDSLYSTTPMVLQILKLRYSFLLVAKPEDHKSPFADIEGLRRGHWIGCRSWGPRDSGTYMGGSTECRWARTPTAQS